MGRDRRIKTIEIDGYTGLNAFVPPPEKRGLVLIDPPFEAPDDFAQMAQALQRGHARARNFVFAAWYPIKHRAPVREFQTQMKQSGIRDIIAADMWLRPTLDASRLNGCGLLVINPPFGFAEAAQAMLTALSLTLADGPDGGCEITRLVDE